MEHTNRSSEFYQMMASRDLYNGTSFRMNTWAPDTFYAHDDINIDFVAYNGALLYCTRSHWSSIENEPILITSQNDIIGIEPNPFWDIVHTKGKSGEKGEKGDPGVKGDKGEKGDPGEVIITDKLQANAVAQESSTPFAHVAVQGTSLNFTFGIPKASNGESGSNGSDGVDGKDGLNGKYLNYLYQDSDSYTDCPDYDAFESNPGSLWSAIIPDRIKGSYVWSIQAYFRDGDFIGPWGNPICLSGIDGVDGNVPNWKTYVYKLSDSKPDKPTSNDLNPDGWADYPNDAGQWWQCIGVVNGNTNKVVWGDVLPVNGRDGIAQDGKHVEMRFALGQYAFTAPTLVNKSDRTPEGWEKSPKSPTESLPYLWMILATINPDDSLDSEWSDPVRISGEQGPVGEMGPAGEPGPAGSQGVSGINGVSIALQYCAGTDETYIASTDESKWCDKIAEAKTQMDKTNLYLWCRQGQRVFANGEDNIGTLEWDEPFRLSGTNGLDGADGDGHGQIIYPMGIYDSTKVYVSDDFKAPYVFDPNGNAFYLLNSSQWDGTINDESPAQHVQNGGTAWIKFDSFEAIYSKVGIIANGLVGSAVFNEDFMFSQMGIDPVTKAAISYCDIDGNMLFSEVDGNPYHSNAKFWPAYCVNLRTGQQWSANGDLCISDNSFTVSPTALPTDSIYGNSFFIETYEDKYGYTDVRSGIKSSSYKTNASITQVVGSLSPTIILESTRIAESGTSDPDIYRTSSVEIDQIHLGYKEIKKASGSGTDLYVSPYKIEYRESSIESDQNQPTLHRSIDFSTGTLSGFNLPVICLPIDSHMPKILEVNQSDNEIYSFGENITSRTIVLYSTDVGANIKLPSLDELTSNLPGYNDNPTSFCVEINFVNVGDSELILYGFSDLNVEGPSLYNARGINSVSLDQKSTVTILFVYDENLSVPYQAYVK